MQLLRLHEKLQAASEQLQWLVDGAQMGPAAPPPTPAFNRLQEGEELPSSRQSSLSSGQREAEGDVNLAEQLEAAGEQIRELSLLLGERESQVRTLVAQLEDMSDFSEAVVRSAKDGTDKVYEALDNELQRTRSRLGRVSHELSALSAHAALQSGQLEHERQEVAQLQDANEALARQVKQLKHMFAEKVRENEDTLQGLETVRDFVLSLEQEVASAVKEQSTLEASQAKLAQEVQELRAALADAHARSSEKDGGGDVGASVPARQMQELREDVRRKAELLKAAMEELEACNTGLQDMARTIAVKDDSITHLHRQLQQVVDELDDAHREVDVLRTCISDNGLEEQLQDDWVPVDDFGSSGGRRKKAPLPEPNKLKEELRDKERALRETNAMVLRLESQVAGLQTVLSTKNMQCHKLEGDARVAETKAREMQAKLRQQEATLGHALEKARQHICGLEGRLNAQSLHCTTTEQQLAHAKHQVRELLAGLGQEVGLDLARSTHSGHSEAPNSCWPPSPSRRNAAPSSFSSLPSPCYSASGPQPLFHNPLPPLLSASRRSSQSRRNSSASQGWEPSNPHFSSLFPMELAADSATSQLDLQLSAEVELQVTPVRALPAAVQATLARVKQLLGSMGADREQLAASGGPPPHVSQSHTTTPGKVLRSITAQQLRAQQGQQHSGAGAQQERQQQQQAEGCQEWQKQNTEEQQMRKQQQQSQPGASERRHSAHATSQQQWQHNQQPKRQARHTLDDQRQAQMPAAGTADCATAEGGSSKKRLDFNSSHFVVPGIVNSPVVGTGRKLSAFMDSITGSITGGVHMLVGDKMGAGGGGGVNRSSAGSMLGVQASAGGRESHPGRVSITEMGWGKVSHRVVGSGEESECVLVSGLEVSTKTGPISALRGQSGDQQEEVGSPLIKASKG